MNSSEKLNLKSKRETVPVNESKPKVNEQAISSVAEELQGFNSGTSDIINSAHKAGVDIEKNDLQELGKLSEETVSAKKEFFGKILNKQELKRYNEILENGESQRASTITNSILKRTKDLINNKSFQKIINHTPYFGDLIMITKMIRGKEGDKKLTAREYLFYSASVLSAAISFYYLTQGNNVSTGIALSVSEGVSYVDSSIGIIKDVSQKVMAKDSKLSGMLSAISNSFSKGKNMLEDISISAANTVKRSFTPDYSFNYAKQ